MAKQATAAQRRRMGLIAELGCVISGEPAELHHCFTRMGGGRNHDHVIPLAPRHHRTGGYGVAIHAGKKAFERIYGTEAELLEKVRILLGENIT